MTVRPASLVSADVPFHPGQPPRPAEPELPAYPGRPSWWPSPGEPSRWPNPAIAPTRVWLDPGEPRGGLYERLMERRIVMAHGHLGDESATRLCAQLLTLDAEGDGPIRFELQNLSADLTAALAVMGVLDVVGVPVRARVAGQISGAALGVLAASSERRAYPNAVFALSEPTVEFGGTMTAVAAREEQTRKMVDSLYFRLADVTGREVDEIRDDARRYRVLTTDEALRYGLITERIEQR
jgi:ATP-dependent Clp protease, protease subunit